MSNMEFWNGTRLSDPVLEQIRLRCQIAENRFNAAVEPVDIDRSIAEMNAAEEAFRQRLAEIRERFFRYGVTDWSRPGRGLRKKTILPRQPSTTTSLSQT